MSKIKSETSDSSTNSNKKETINEGWLLQCPPGLAPVLKKELVFAGCIKRDQTLFVQKQRNHDLVFANHLKSNEGMDRLRIAEIVLRCPVYGRFKLSKRQLGVMASELKQLGPRRLVVTVAGRVFERHDLARWVTKELSTLGYDFDPDIEDEVWMFCIDESWYFGIPLKKGREAEGRNERVAERRGSLPPPIAAAMAFAGMPKPEDVVFDPVCGSGTLLAECYSYSPNSIYIGADKDPEAVAIARANLNGLQNVELQNLDSRKTAWSRTDISLVLANLPFGMQFGEKQSNPQLYRDLLQEQLRLRDTTKTWRAIILTSDIESLQAALNELPMLTSESLFKVKIRGELAFASRLKIR
jgi:predicted RNA methylase